MNYQLFEQILRYIQERAWKDNSEKKRAMNKMFEFLQPFANRPIEKRFGIDKLYNLKNSIINAVLDRE